MNNYTGFSILQGKSIKLFEEGDNVAIHRIFEASLNSTREHKNYSDTIQGTELGIDEPVIYYKKTVTRIAQVNEEANQLARVIYQTFKPVINSDGNIVIAVHMAPSHRLIVTLLAILKLNSAYLPLDNHWTNHRIQYILKEAQVTLVITDKNDEKRFQGSPIVTFDELYQTTLDIPNDNLSPKDCWNVEEPEEKRISIVLYTSGSTGVPKGVRLSNQNILNMLKWQWKNFPYSETERVTLFKTSLAFVDSLPELWGPLLTGHSLVVLSKKDAVDPERLINTCNKFRIERLIVTPSLLYKLVPYIKSENKRKQIEQSTYKNPVLPHVKICVTSGEFLHKSLAKSFYKYLPEVKTTLYNFYESTEITGGVLFYPLPGKDILSKIEHIPLGKPVDNTTIYILDNLLQPVKTGQVGEIFASGLNVASGYVRNESDKFLDNPHTSDPNHSKLYRLGDFGRMENGMIYFEGRGDSQIKVRGHRVNGLKVEAALSTLLSVHRSAVLCYKSGHVDQALLAFVVPKEHGLDDKSVEDELAMILPQYMIPKVIVVSEIPLLSSNKVDRQQLFSNYESEINPAPTNNSEFDLSVIPRDCRDTAKALFQVVALALGHSLGGKINASSNFYDLGGSSLNTVSVVTKLCDIGYIINIRDFINANTLLDVIHSMRKDGTTNDVSICDLRSMPANEYTIELIKTYHKRGIFALITECYSHKGLLENFCSLKIRKEHYEEVLEGLWESLLDEQITFVIKDREGEIQAVALNRDGEYAAGLEGVSRKNSWMRIIGFCERMEKNVSEGYLPKGKVFTNMLLGTAESVSTQDNVKLILIAEHEIIRLAKERGYIGVYGNNVNPLAKQICQDLFNYQVLMEYQINKYVTPDGTHLFPKADDSVKAQLMWLDL